MHSCKPLWGDPMLIAMESSNLHPAPPTQSVPEASKAWAHQQRKTEQGDSSNREHLDLLGES